jgi:uncharacterized repeat protein (TIGR03803 family)
MDRIVNLLCKPDWGKRAYAVFALCATTAIGLPAQTLTTLYSFCSQSGCPDGASPLAGLTQGSNGDLYGTTQSDGVNCANCGTIFKITPSGSLSTLYSFCSESGCADGFDPAAVLVQGIDGAFYGTTYGGGTIDEGTVFKITPSGKLTTLYSFCSQNGCDDGENPNAGLVQATNGDFYGTTEAGGNGWGTIFKITQSGTLTTVHSFCAQSMCADGGRPVAGLVQGIDGDLYGTTGYGGANYACPNGCGWVFKITPSGTLTTLHSFAGYPTEGYTPCTALVQGIDGDFYGTTLGGASGAPKGAGTVFKITPSGTLTTLYSFCSQIFCPDGAEPLGGLVQGTDGSFYGTTFRGAYGGGTIFKIIPSGTLTTLYRFCTQSGCADGAKSAATLIQDTNGDFYGATSAGGANFKGTVFSLSVGLGPFVKMQPTSGEAGAIIKILGTDLTGATSVSFDGTEAAFRVVSNSLIMTMVPAGASSGKLQVVTPSGTLVSNVAFRVGP